MGFSYLDGLKWAELTREERFFCSRLYWDINRNVPSFIEWLRAETSLGVFSEIEWEVSFEVCIYRDIHKLKNQSIKNSRYPEKRTFDLCLFSESNIIVIEAKVQQPFDRQQIEEFRKDKELIRDIVGNNVDISLVALASSTYFINLNKFGNKEVLNGFDACITWRQMAEKYENPVFSRADMLYKK